MTNEHDAGEYYCPYDSCSYSAPTETQVRSHITLAEHGDHEGEDGYTLGVQVVDSDGNRHGYEGKNKVSLPDVTLSDITDDVKGGKQLILKIAYNNPEQSYTDIHEQAEQEQIDYSYGRVRDIIKEHIEAASDETNDTAEPDQESDSDATDTDPEPFLFGSSVTATDPFTAGPTVDPRRTTADAAEQTDAESDSTPPEPDSASAADDQAPAQPADSDHTELHYDTGSIPDYWTDKQQKIIATYKALDDPTVKEVHSKLPGDIYSDKIKSYVYSVLWSWNTDSYDELSDCAQQAVDALIRQDADETLAELARRENIRKETLGAAKHLFPHILRENGVPISTGPPDPSAVPFDVKQDLDGDWTPLQKLIISGYEAYDQPTDPELRDRLAEHGISVARTTIQQTISAYTDGDRRYEQQTTDEKTFADLNDRQQAAVELLTEKPPEEPITKFAETLSENRAYLYRIHNTYQHIIENKGTVG